MGKISIANKPGGLSENDVRLVTVFAAQAAVVIQNAHLYRRLQESAAQLEAKVHERTAELEATYRELEASHARLREVDQLKSDFLGNVSHELRTPLAAVKGYVDNLLDGVAGPLTEKLATTSAASATTPTGSAAWCRISSTSPASRPGRSSLPRSRSRSPTSSATR